MGAAPFSRRLSRTQTRRELIPIEGSGVRIRGAVFDPFSVFRHPILSQYLFGQNISSYCCDSHDVVATACSSQGL